MKSGRNILNCGRRKLSNSLVINKNHKLINNNTDFVNNVLSINPFCQMDNISYLGGIA